MLKNIVYVCLRRWVGGIDGYENLGGAACVNLLLSP